MRLRALGIGLLIVVANSGCAEPYIVRNLINVPPTPSSAATATLEYTAYCNSGDYATGGGCGVSSPTRGWTVQICDPIGLSPSGSPNISPSTGQKPIGWRMRATGPGAQKPDNLVVFSVCDNR